MTLRAYARRITPTLSRAFRANGAWPDECVHAIALAAAKLRPEAEAVVDAARRVTFGELLAALDGAARDLAARGVGPRSVVCLWSADGAEFVAAHLAISRLGAVTLSLPSTLSAREVSGLARIGDADALIVDSARAADATRELATDLPVFTFTHAAGSPLLAFDRAQPPADPGDAAWTCDADADYMMMATAGTTGIPKLAVRTHNSWLAMARKKLATLGSLALSERDAVLVLSPISQGIGYLHGFLLPLLVPGMRRVLLEKFDAGKALELVERERPTILVGVPAQAIKLLQHDDLRRRDLSSVRMFQSGGDHFPAEQRAAFERDLGIPVISDYGASDVGAACAPWPDDPLEKRLHTVGRPMPWTEVALVDEDGRVVPGGSVGEVAVAGPDLISGYYPEQTGDRGDPLVRTGDLGRFDDDGYLVVVGRKKDLIIRGGVNISPVEIESCIRRHPRVRDVAVVGLPDPVLGERVCAFVVVADAGDLDVAELSGFLEGQGVSKFKWPERVVRMPELPLSPGGKVRKDTLRSMLA